MARDAEQSARVFKTAWFSRAARKAHIDDKELCTAIRQVMLGQADDLGGGVWKKRLSKKHYRSIIVAKGGRYWVYEFLFAKQDLANISDKQLSELRYLAKIYAVYTLGQVNDLLKHQDWMEICHGNET